MKTQNYLKIQNWRDLQLKKKTKMEKRPTETFCDQTAAFFSDLCSLRGDSLCKCVFKLHSELSLYKIPTLSSRERESSEEKIKGRSLLGTVSTGTSCRSPWDQPFFLLLLLPLLLLLLPLLLFFFFHSSSSSFSSTFSFTLAHFRRADPFPPVRYFPVQPSATENPWHVVRYLPRHF